jgi:hypothetical protein
MVGFFEQGIVPKIADFNLELLINYWTLLDIFWSLRKSCAYCMSVTETAEAKTRNLIGAAFKNHQIRTEDLNL